MRYITKQKAPLLDQLQLMAPESSKSTLRNWLKFSRIKVNNTIMKTANTLIEPHSEIKLMQKGPKTLAENVKIIYQDAHFIVIDKPAHLLSVETDREKWRTAHGILKRYAKTRVYPVHRLDRETSGVMVFATSLEALQGLKEQFAAHTIYREYFAKVEGLVEKDAGTLKFPLLEDSQYHMHIDPKGEMAITHFEVLRRGDDQTDLKCTLETGKKNQIRAHLAHVGHPILGDRKYGSAYGGLMQLRAVRLKFVHPVTGKQMEFS